jgi:hypothetical protein
MERHQGRQEAAAQKQAEMKKTVAYRATASQGFSKTSRQLATEEDMSAANARAKAYAYTYIDAIVDADANTHNDTNDNAGIDIVNARDGVDTCVNNVV